MATSITLTQPDDWHLHVRTGDMLNHVINDTAKVFGRAVIMPNLTPAITTVDQANHYRQAILSACQYADFDPLMTLYLTDTTTPDEIAKAAKDPNIYAAKLYPAGATTNSSQGIAKLDAIYPLLEAMTEHNLPLLIHGEVTTPEMDIFDREKGFIDQYLIPITQKFSSLRIVLEHITTSDAAQFVLSQPSNVAATITAHHLLLNRNDMLAGGIRPHYYCLPILKRQSHQAELIKVATSGSAKFFLGTDSAPHTQNNKESACGCAGCYTAINAMPLYAQAFEAANALNKLEGFASHFGADFYELPRNKKTITLSKQDWVAPEYINVGNERLIPFFAGKTLSWQVTQHA
ncbi:MAG: dihydroorotase [Methylococcales bacterium]|jgi:dihydroorotase|nr:dihydroorotase [Methylococcales bacterium]MBT7445160.1 dihydroorotase [Methylococcales bacterium]